MIERKTEVFTVEVNSDNSVGVKIALMIVENEEVIDYKWHRALIGPAGQGHKTTKEMMVDVNNHLNELGMVPVSEAGIDRIDKIHALAQTL